MTTNNKFSLIFLLAIYATGFSQKIDNTRLIKAEDKDGNEVTAVYHEFSKEDKVDLKNKPEEIKKRIKEQEALAKQYEKKSKFRFYETCSNLVELYSYLDDIPMMEYYYKILKKGVLAENSKHEAALVLLEEYLEQGRANSVVNFFDSNPDIFEYKMGCGNEIAYYDKKLIRLRFLGYYEVGDINNALTWGFKCNLNDDEVSKRLVRLLSEKYSVENLTKATFKLKNKFVRKTKFWESYFIFLDYKIVNLHRSKIYINHSRSPFEQLQESHFYRKLTKYLNIN
ncbi:MAG: hypothetical protein HRT68_11260 [Flavobacteriaceae bacterium]|nr:hypothetical protein [Flavobacteriaceae bacterium]